MHGNWGLLQTLLCSLGVGCPPSTDFSDSVPSILRQASVIIRSAQMITNDCRRNQAMTSATRSRSNSPVLRPGLFMAMLAIGAAWGRLIGQLVAAVLRRLDVPLAISMPAYAVVGAAAALGEVTRTPALLPAVAATVALRNQSGIA